jgi:inorganic pyrophosphatase
VGKKKGGLANPIRLSAVDQDGDVQVVIETPKGSRNKYAFDPELRTFKLKKVLPEGMVFPHNFGFIPSTKAEDGDPLDVLILMDQPAFPGCVIDARLVGCPPQKLHTDAMQPHHPTHIHGAVHPTLAST